MSEGPDKLTWQPISRDDLLSEIASGEAVLAPSLRGLWGRVRIEPAKWSLPPWGDAGGGFWVVAILGDTVIWYNDIEGGFDLSRFDSLGRIGQYGCSQMELEHCINSLFPKISD